MTRFAAVPLALVALLAVCGQAAAQSTAPGVALTAPAGTYTLDPNHRSLVGKLQHNNLAPYSIRFTKFEVTLNLDPKNVAASSVEVTLDPTSVRTDYTGDYKGTHKDSPYGSFEERISREDKFLNSDKFPNITFKSTKVESTGPGKLRVTGDLTFLGQTHPVTLDAIVTGSADQHPFTKKGAIGFKAVATFNRSEWGMTGTQQYLGDAITVEFNGEFHQAEAQEAAPTTG